MVITQKSNSIFRNNYNLLIFMSVLVSLALWVFVRFSGSTKGTINYVFALMLGVTPFLASFKGFKASKAWGGLKSVLGRSIGALSLGLLLWSIGEFIWSYYNLIPKIQAPYPSWADFGYMVGVIFWIISTIYLAKLTGIGVLLKRKPILRYVVFLVVICSLALSYYLVVQVARQGHVTSKGSSSLKTLLDIAYPLTDIISLTIIAVVATVSGRYLGGLLKKPVLFVLVGMLASYIFDLIFSYTTTIGTYYNAQPADIFLLIATALLSFALLYYAQGVQPLSKPDSGTVEKGQA